MADLKRDKYSSLVDFGCGNGFLLNEISKIKNDVDLHGIDISERRLRRVRSLYPHIGFHSVALEKVTHEFNLNSPLIVSSNALGSLGIVELRSLFAFCIRCSFPILFVESSLDPNHREFSLKRQHGIGHHYNYSKIFESMGLDNDATLCFGDSIRDGECFELFCALGDFKSTASNIC